MPDNPLLWTAEHVGEAPVAIEDRPILPEGDGAFLYLLDQNPIRMIDALQDVKAVIVFPRGYHHRVYIAVPNGFEGIVFLLVERLKLGDALAECRYLCRCRLRVQMELLNERMPRPTNTFSVSERVPMIRFSGDGRRRTRVGIAKI